MSWKGEKSQFFGDPVFDNSTGVIDKVFTSFKIIAYSSQRQRLSEMSRNA